MASRTALIEKVAAEKGVTDLKRKDGRGAETPKRKNPPLAGNRGKKSTARLTDRERIALAAVPGREHVAYRHQRGERLAVDHAIEHSLVREAVPERRLVTEALKRGIGAVTVEDVTREMLERTLIRSDITGRKMATTKEMLALESRLIDFARQGRGRCRPFGDPERPCSRDCSMTGRRRPSAMSSVSATT